MLYIDNTLLTALIALSLLVIVGGMTLVWRLTAPVERPEGADTEAKKKKKEKKEKKDTKVATSRNLNDVLSQ